MISWRVAKDNSGSNGAFVVADDPSAFRGVRTVAFVHEKADAALIAHASKMLRTLRDLHQMFEDATDIAIEGVDEAEQVRVFAMLADVLDDIERMREDSNG